VNTIAWSNRPPILAAPSLLATQLPSSELVILYVSGLATMANTTAGAIGIILIIVYIFFI
jgi:hypothetical protein